LQNGGTLSKFVFLLVILLAASSAMSAAPRGPAITFIEENDDFTMNGDKHYTQGIRLSYMHSELHTPKWAGWLADRIPHFGMKIDAPRVGYTLGQSIYTPDNLGAEQMITDDRPYAGWLYIGLVLQREGVTAKRHIPVLDTFQFHTGVIGPESFAETVQNWWHDSTGFIIPRGWENQLKTEPGFVFKHLRQWKYSTGSEGFAAEFMPHIGGSLGNVATFANLGAMVRVGYNIPDDWGVHTIDSLGVQMGRRDDAKEFGIYGFATLDGRAVLHNAFLDGNTFRGSHHIDKCPLVGELRTGVVVTFRRLDIAATYAMRTREYRGQPSNDSFGSISLNAKF
jgi:lipid A 3-O-deacylase